MKQSTYIAPQATISEMELEGFLCTSIQTLTMIVEVDEYQNMGEEVVTF